MLDMREAFEKNQAEIARRVVDASECIDLPASEVTGSIATHMRVRDNGSISIYQPAGMVTLTQSQAVELMDRIGVMVLKGQVERVMS